MPVEYAELQLASTVGYESSWDCGDGAMFLSVATAVDDPHESVVLTLSPTAGRDANDFAGVVMTPAQVRHLISLLESALCP